LAIAMLATVAHLWDPIGIYDEGVLLTDAQLMLRGAVPFRDFYTNYPPGIFLLIVALFKLFGMHAVLLRFVGMVIHVLIAALVGRLAGRLAERPFLPLPAGIALAYLLTLNLVPYAYLVSVCLALAFVDFGLASIARPRPWSFFVAGLIFGSVAAFRHDLFIYLACGLGVVGLAEVLRRRVLTDAATVRSALRFAIGAALPLSAIWIPVFVRAGFRQIAADLYFDQVLAVPARVLPFPRMLPDLFRDPYAGAVAILALGPVLLLWAWLTARSHQQRLGVLLLGAVALALVPQSVCRSDLAHVVFGIWPAIVLMGVLIERLASRAALRQGVLAAIPAFWLIILVAPLTSDTQVLARPFAPGSIWNRPPMVEPWSRSEVLGFISQNTAPGEPIYVGATDHRRVLISEMDLYFLADRPGAVRRMQFDPNLTTRPEVQTIMIAELESKRPKVAVLSSECYWDEPNHSRDFGSTLLDEYLSSHYREVKHTGHYRLMLRQAEAT
jgi:hypothetical protein